MEGVGGSGVAKQCGFCESNPRMIASKILKFKEIWQQVLAMIGYVALNVITLAFTFGIDYFVNKNKSLGAVSVVSPGDKNSGYGNPVEEKQKDEKTVGGVVPIVNVQDLKEARDRALSAFKIAETNLSNFLEELNLLRKENDDFSAQMIEAAAKCHVKEINENPRKEDLDQFTKAEKLFNDSNSKIRAKLEKITPLVNSYKQALVAFDEACEAAGFANFDEYDRSKYNINEAWAHLQENQLKLKLFMITKNNMKELDQIVTIAEELVQIYICMHLVNTVNYHKSEALRNLKQVRIHRDKLIDAIFTSVSRV
jgi:hypothetical protein